MSPEGSKQLPAPAVSSPTPAQRQALAASASHGRPRRSLAGLLTLTLNRAVETGAPPGTPRSRTTAAQEVPGPR